MLGVPGTYDEQEQNMARMFGFPDFRPAEKNVQLKGGPEGQTRRIFGYWCRDMND